METPQGDGDKAEVVGSLLARELIIRRVVTVAWSA